MTSTTERGFVSLASAVARRIRDDDLIREGLRSVSLASMFTVPTKPLTS